MSVLANLGAVMVRPRRTMRRILDGPRDRMLVVLVLLATLSGIAGDLSIAEVSRIYGLGDMKMKLVLPAALLGTLIVMPLVFYIFGWIAFAIGRALEGTADVAAVRRALAWGLVPIIWALLYRIPAMFFKPAADLSKVSTGRNTQISLDAGLLSSGCGMVAVFVLLDLVTLIWWLVVTSQTLAEAEGFSGLRGFGTVVLCLIAPIVIGIAAFLAT